MFRKMVLVVALGLVCGLSVAQAEQWDRAVYWDARCRTGWADHASSIVVRDGCIAAGYTLLDADQLKTWMEGHIADGALSVVVLARDNVPSTVVETVDPNCTLRKYLDAGGKIVFYADIPFWDVANTDGTWTNPQTAAGDAILGIGANLVWDTNNEVTITQAGRQWGVTQTWASLRATPADKVDVVLATDSAGNAAAWVKHFVPGDTYRGFVRLYDRPGRPPVQDIIYAAEYPYIFVAPHSPKPADGIPNWLPDFVLSCMPSPVAKKTTWSFGTDPDAMALMGDMMGPMPDGTVMAFFADPAVLVPGETFYWRVDTDTGAEVVEGPVWSFTVMPMEAHFPSPYDGKRFALADTKLSWSAGQAAVTHNVYFGTDEALVAARDPSVRVAEGLMDTSFDPNGLAADSTYYWCVDEDDTAGTIFPGPVWSFTSYDSTGGAVAEYWNNRFLTGKPKVVTTVGAVNFDWGGGAVHGINSPDPTIWVDNFSCRWWAELDVPVTGTYRLYDASDDGARLYLNGQRITDGWWDRGTTEDASGDLELVAGERYLVMMEMYENGGGATAFLRWEGPGMPKDIIGPGYLQIPEMATGFFPANGATGVADLPELSWIAGKTAVGHDVFLGTDPNLVAAGDAGTLQGRVVEATFVPAKPLAWNTEYYWRVDEVRADGSVVPGIVVKFTVVDNVVFDDFEGYAPTPVAPSKAPIGWWKLDGTFADSSGNGRDGTPMGNGIQFIDDPIMGSVLNLPGGDNVFVEIGAVGISGNAQTTIACWAKADSTTIPDWTLIFGFTGDAAGAGGNGSHFNIGSLGGPGGVGAHCWGWEETIFSDQAALEWHHYAATYDGTTVRYYGDGFPMDTDPAKSNVIDLTIRGDRVHIGSRVTQASSFPGCVADARIYDYALSDAEVAGVASIPTVSDVWKGSGGVSSLDMDYVFSGLKALTFTYDGPAEVTCTPALPVPQGSVAGLSLWFYGDSASTADEVYLKVNGTKLPLQLDPKDGSWEQAVVDLTALDLQVIDSLAIGVSGGKGILTVDDIKLHRPGTVPVVNPNQVVFVSFHTADDAPTTNAINAGFTEAVDKAYTDLLKANGYEVTRFASGVPNLASAVFKAADLIILSRSTSSGHFQNANATAWNNVPTPVICLNGYLLRKNRLGITTGNTMKDIVGDVTLTVNDPAHPIFAGIALTDGTMNNPFAGVPVYPTDGTTVARGISVNTDAPNAEGTVLATLSAASGDAPAGAMMIAEWQAGATITHDGGAGTDILADHWLVFLTGAREASGKSSETAGIYDLYPDGEQMLLNAAAYMLE